MRHVPLEPVAELLELLEEAGVSDAPREGPDQTRLQAVLAFALHLAERHKRVDFTPFSWADPRFLSKDAKAEVEIIVEVLDGPSVEQVAATFERALARPHGKRALLAIDARASGITEFVLGHHLYGEVTLSAWPHKPAHPQDPRISEAAEGGWIATLKEHNLLPGRGIVVRDDEHGLFLTDPVLEDAIGAFVLLPTNQIPLLLNPFARKDIRDPEMQHWLAWGSGTGAASEWRRVLDVKAEEED